LKKKDNGVYDGIFYNVTEKMIKWACGNCKNGHGKTDVNLKSNGKGGVAYKDGAIDVVNDIDEIPHLSFPIYGNQYMNKYMGMYEYIHFMDSPGVAFITISDPAEQTGDRIINSVIGCIPLLIIALFMALLAGFVVWFFVSKIYLFISIDMIYTLLIMLTHIALLTTFLKGNSRFCILAKYLHEIITLTRKSMTESLAIWPNLRFKIITGCRFIVF
jgi:hypothetical protein